MNDNPLVSIIVITYNSSKFVLETLESAKEQTYQNIELIVSDDCSTDNTIEICREWIVENGDRFVRTELITVEKNTGIPANCNRGVKVAIGEWIKYIAGDDILLENCIELNLNFSAIQNANFIYSEMTYFNEKNNNILTNKTLQNLYTEFSNLSCNGQLIFYRRLPVFLNTPTWFIKKSEIVSFDEKFKYLEDHHLVFIFLENNYKIFFMNKNTVKYRRHEQSVQGEKISELRKDYYLSYVKYRKKHLTVSSLLDSLFIVNFFCNQLIMRYSRIKLINKFFFYICKLNPVRLFNIKPYTNMK